MSDRIITELMRLGDIGFVVGGGTNRVAYTDAFFKGRDYVQNIMNNSGLQTRIDAVGNLYGTTPEGTGKKIAIGSHLDTVPNGGKYDGALGVIAGIACVRRLREEGYQFKHPIEIIGFNEEEGNAVGGTFGSRCMCGQEIGDKERKSLPDVGLTEEAVSNSKCCPDDYLCYLEMHIEQGGSLERENLCIGAVEGIVGIVRFHATVNGASNHAGSTPMYLRDDALVTSCGIISRLIQLVTEYDSTMVCTVGEFTIPNSAVNVIPGKTEFLIELRYKNVPGMLEVIRQLQEEYPDPILQLHQFLHQDETAMDDRITSTVENICNRQAIPYKRMFSGAGHDAINTARIIPTGLFFIPSKNGISHSIQEYSSPSDIECGLDVLCELVKTIDKGEIL